MTEITWVRLGLRLGLELGFGLGLGLGLGFNRVKVSPGQD
jgi:hypothetical protein